MAAEDGGKPPTHPRRRTPDHPPYAVMIAAAIQTSSEEGGSTVEAISRYIRSHYDDLPDGHDNLLPYYLSKLTAQGEFVMPEPGRFLVAACAGAKPAPGSRPYRAQPSPARRLSPQTRKTTTAGRQSLLRRWAEIATIRSRARTAKAPRRLAPPKACSSAVMRVTSNHWNTFLACHGKGLRSLRPRLRLRTKEMDPTRCPSVADVL